MRAGSRGLRSQVVGAGRTGTALFYIRDAGVTHPFIPPRSSSRAGRSNREGSRNSAAKAALPKSSSEERRERQPFGNDPGTEAEHPGARLSSVGGVRRSPGTRSGVLGTARELTGMEESGP